MAQYNFFKIILKAEAEQGQKIETVEEIIQFSNILPLCLFVK